MFTLSFAVGLEAIWRQSVGFLVLAKKALPSLSMLPPFLLLCIVF